MDVFDPFITYLRQNPDFNEQDSKQETKQLIERQGIIEEVLLGNESIDFLLDVLEAQGMNPDQYVQTVVCNIDTVVNQPYQFTSNELGLFVPLHLQNHG